MTKNLPKKCTKNFAEKKRPKKFAKKMGQKIPLKQIPKIIHQKKKMHKKTRQKIIQ